MHLKGKKVNNIFSLFHTQKKRLFDYIERFVFLRKRIPEMNDEVSCSFHIDRRVSRLKE